LLTRFISRDRFAGLEIRHDFDGGGGGGREFGDELHEVHLRHALSAMENE
jgi:hypothetical protein